MSEESLIERLRARAQDPTQATDEGSTVAAPPATDEQIAVAERTFGFRLPTLLRLIYREIGNGGFGPGTGLPRLPTNSKEAPSLPQGLVLLCEWGSGIASVLDGSRPEAPVIRVDPNMPKGDVAVRVPPAKHYPRAKEIKDACWVESAAFTEWLEAWLDGKPLFYAAYGGAEVGEDDDEDGDEEEDEDE
jgi:hypothetical protein